MTMVGSDFAINRRQLGDHGLTIIYLLMLSDLLPINTRVKGSGKPLPAEYMQVKLLNWKYNLYCRY